MVDNSIMDRYVEESSLKMNEKSKQHIRTLLTKFFGIKSDVAYNDLTLTEIRTCNRSLCPSKMFII